jgi:F-type H+-transporting ATPase subunit gamma
MGQNLQQLKKRINTAKSIAQMTKAMEMIAASKIKKAQSSVEKSRPYEEKIRYVVQKILADSDLAQIRNIFVGKASGTGKHLFFIISPDKGLCGGLLTNLLKKAAHTISKGDIVVTVGKKAEILAAREGYDVAASFAFGTNFPDYDSIYPMINLATRYYVGGEVQSVELIYARFKNALSQEIIQETLMPIALDEDFKNSNDHYLFEPSSAEVLEQIIPYYIEVEFFNALINAYASEQAARMMAMGAAKENAFEISDNLTGIYNKSRQEKITSEILDLANGQI